MRMLGSFDDNRRRYWSGDAEGWFTPGAEPVPVACYHCGTQNAPAAEKCVSCGTTLTGADAARKRREAARKALDDGTKALDNGRFPDAGLLLERAAALDPVAVEPHYLLGVLYQRMNDVHGALKHLRRAVNLDATHTASWQALADLHKRSGDIFSARMYERLASGAVPAVAIGAAKKMLIVDDDPRIVRLIRLLVSANWGTGVQIDWSEDGADGRLKAMSGEYDLLTLDLNMPMMGGLEALGMLRGNPKTMRTPVIVVTADNDPATEERAKRMGVTGYLLKPFTPDQLVGCMRPLLGEPTAGR